jgi:hypothetical protein
MPVAAETHSLGTPVELEKIEQELKKLWREGEGAMTRASLMNFAVYSEQPGSLNNNTQLMAKITENHACRAIVTEAHCRSEENRVDSWISAHCHVSSTGNKQVCSEQISFLLNGGCTAQLPSIVLSNLDSDLPLYLWWQEEFREPLDPQLWTWVDRVIYDSHGWADVRGHHSQPCRHRFHDHCGQIVHAAVGIGHARKHENVCRTKPPAKLRLRRCAGQHDIVLQTEFADLLAQLALKRAFTDDFTAEQFPTFGEQRAGAN